MSQEKIAFIHHIMDEKVFWGGDKKNIQSLCDGLEEIGYTTSFTNAVESCLDANYVFLVNAGNDITSSYYYLELMEKEYGMIGFYEDVSSYYPVAGGLFYYIRSILEEKSELGYCFSLERLLENPKLIYYYPTLPKKTFFKNYDVLKDAKLYIAQCETEAKCVQRDCPQVQICSLFPDRRVPEILSHEVTNTFLDYTQLSSRRYILQVGRFELRKNQLATVIACRNMDVPLVFIATGNCKDPKKMREQKKYDEVLLAAIKKWRKAPTIILSQYMKSQKQGSLQIIQMPNKEKLADSFMSSAFAHAGLYVHPAFYELPGLVYIEAMVYGTPVVASNWTALREYFTDEKGVYHIDGRVEYSTPYDLENLTELVEKKFGAIYKPYTSHPLLCKSKADIAKSFMDLIQEHYVSYK